MAGCTHELNKKKKWALILVTVTSNRTEDELKAALHLKLPVTELLSFRTRKNVFIRWI
jgi:hypothetical protein